MTAAAGDAHPFPIYNARFRAVFPIIMVDGSFLTGAGGLDSEVSQDQAAFADAAFEATEIAQGVYYLDLLHTELDNNHATVLVKTTTSGGRPTLLTLNPRRLPVLLSGITHSGGNDLITFASGSSDQSGAYVGCYVLTLLDVPNSGAGQARRIIAYSGTGRVAQVHANWGTNPASGNGFNILVPDGTTHGAGFVTNYSPWNVGRLSRMASGTFGEYVNASVTHASGTPVYNFDMQLASGGGSTITLPSTDAAGNSVPDDAAFQFCAARVVAGTGINQIVLLTSGTGTARQYNVLAGTMPVATDHTTQVIVLGAWRANVAFMTSGTITAASIASGAYTFGKFASGGLASGNIVSGSIIAGSVDNAAIADAVWDNLVSGNQLSGSAGWILQMVHSGLASGVVVRSILSGTVTFDSIASGAFGFGKFASGSISSGHIVSGALLGAAEINTDAIADAVLDNLVSGHNTSGTFGWIVHTLHSGLNSGAVVKNILSGVITSDSIASGAFAAGKFASGSLASGHILSGAVLGVAATIDEMSIANRVWEHPVSGHSISGTFGWVMETLHSGICSGVVVRSNLSGVITSDSIASGAFAAGKLASGAFPQGIIGSGVIDAAATTQLTFRVLAQNYSGITGEGRHSMVNAMRKLTARWRISGGIIEFFKEDGSTQAYTQTVSSLSGASPIIGLT